MYFRLPLRRERKETPRIAPDIHLKNSFSYYLDRQPITTQDDVKYFSFPVFMNALRAVMLPAFTVVLYVNGNWYNHAVEST